jgi:hypothetical protein
MHSFLLAILKKSKASSFFLLALQPVIAYLSMQLKSLALQQHSFLVQHHLMAKQNKSIIIQCFSIAKQKQ